MKKPLAGSVLSLLALGSAWAQNPAVTPQQRVTSPLVRDRAVVAPSVASPAAAARQDQPAATAKAVLPSNILTAEDRSIIIVGGKHVAAGAIKQQIQAELRKQSVPASARFTRPQAPQPLPVLENKPGRLGTHVRDRADAVTMPPRAGGIRQGSEVAQAQAGLSYSELINYCKTHPAEITRVRGVVTPNARFRIEGLCFGTTTGRVEAIGQFPGGNMRLVFESWTENEIQAFVPAVSGAADHVIALTVVRADQVRSPAAQAQFVAARQVLPVPPGYWSQDPNFIAIDVDKGGGSIFTSYTVFGAGSPQRHTPFGLRVNPACALESAAWSSRTGSVDAFNGWDASGPPNVANVDVVWTPRCITQTFDYVFGSDIQRVCSVEYTLQAWASCPVGLAP